MRFGPSSVPRFSILCLVALLAYAVFVAAHSSPVAAGSDSAGYLLSAKLLSQGTLSTPLRTLPEFPPAESWEYTPLGMIYSERLGELIPTYPIGLPLFYAAAAAIAGWSWGPVLVSTLMACGAVLFTFLCARELGVRREIAVLCAVGLAGCPLLFYTTFQPLSDTATACWDAVALFLALRARSRGVLAWSIAAGFAFAVSVLLRPANLLMLPALAVALQRPRLLLGACIGGLPGAIFLGWYQHVLYGSVLITGYGSVWGMFGPEHVAPSLHKYIAWIPVFLPLSVLAVVLAPWLPWRSRARELLALILWILAYGAFYAFYPPTHENRWYLRFVVPMFPALLVIAALGMEAGIQRIPEAVRAITHRPVLGLALGVTLAASWQQWRTAKVGTFADNAQVFAEIPIWCTQNLPADAIILTLHPSCAFYYYTDRAIIRSDVIKPARFAELKQVARTSERDVFAIVTRADDDPGFKDRLAGTWAEYKRFGDFGIWRLEVD